MESKEQIQAEKETKACPFCGETILSVAVRCKHCKSDLIEKEEEKKRSNAPSVGALIGLSISIWFWFFYDVTTSPFVKVNTFDYILSQQDYPETAEPILWGMIAVTTIILASIVALIFKVLFK